MFHKIDSTRVALGWKRRDFEPVVAKMQHGSGGVKGPSPSSTSASAAPSVIARQQPELDSDSHSDDEHDNDGSTHNGKRKRPTSVSYVQS